MKQNFQRALINFNNSGFGCLLTIILIGFFFGSVGLGWVVNGVLFFIAFLFVAPVVIFWVFRWWLKRNLVEDQCPVCGYEFMGFNNVQSSCPNCGENLKVESGKFQRITPPGTIDVDVIDVPTQRLED